MKTSINLLPPALRRQQILRRRIIQWAAVVGLVLLTIWIAGWAKLRECHSLSQKLEILTREHQPNQAMLQELVTMRSTQSELRQQEAVATELEQQRHVLALLGVVSQTAEQSDGKLRVTNLTLVDLQGSSGGSRASESQSGRLILSGESVDNPAVAELLDRLQDSGLFSNVKLVSLNERQSGGITLQDYEIRCDL